MKNQYQQLLLTISLLIILVTAAAGCSSSTGQSQEPDTDQPRSLTVMTHDSFAVSEELVSQFESEQNAELQFLEVGDTGTAVNRAVLTRDQPLADVFYGVDNTFLSRALEEEIFEPYQSPLLEEIPDSFELDPQHRALPVDFGDVCLNYQIAYFEENNLNPPASLEDLSDPAYKGLLTVQNPASSSPGLAFLMATIGRFGPEGFLDYWAGLVENEVNVVNDWETAYYSDFTQAGGSDPIVVSYASSPPFEVLFSEEPLEDAPTAAVTADGSCFRQIEFVGILVGTEKRDLAEAWVDFMLSTDFQEGIPLTMYVFPVNENAELDPIFLQYLEIPEQTAEVSYQAIAENRESWVEAWRELVLQ
jgi:thiamine transport system substrate-binding protein